MTLTLEKTRLRTLLGDYPNTMALKKAEVTSNIVNFDFADVKVANTAFKPLVREARFDVGELAIVTYLQARDHGKPYVLIPATVSGRGQHHTIVYNPQRGALSAHDLAGKRIGVRAYTQTTGGWVRGFLSDDFGVELACRLVRAGDPSTAPSLYVCCERPSQLDCGVSAHPDGREGAEQYWQRPGKREADRQSTRVFDASTGETGSRFAIDRR